MIDLGVVLTWAAISAVSVKGLGVLARAATTGDGDGDPALVPSDARLALQGLRSIGAPPSRLTQRSSLAAPTDAPHRARARL